MKLIPLSDFVLEQEKAHFYGQTEWSTICERIIKYTKFLKQPLTLGMFVPCDEKGNVLEEPYFDGINEVYYTHAKHWYEEAKEKVLFEGFELIEGNLKKDGLGFCTLESFSLIDMEDMIRWHEDIELTPSALEAIGIK